MKDVILEILLDKVKATAHDFYPTSIEGLPQSAREIAELMTAFIEWIRRNADGEGTDEWFIGDDKLYTLEELFTFWHTEIYKKQKP